MMNPDVTCGLAVETTRSRTHSMEDQSSRHHVEAEEEEGTNEEKSRAVELYFRGGDGTELKDEFRPCLSLPLFFNEVCVYSLDFHP